MADQNTNYQDGQLTPSPERNKEETGCPAVQGQIKEKTGCPGTKDQNERDVGCSETQDPHKHQEEYLRAQMEKTGVPVTPDMVRQLMDFYHYLIEKNQVMNLTAITEFADVVNKHFADSVLPAQYLPMDAVSTVLDLGCGAGFPGLPLKICYPQLSVTLLDAVGKKVRFVQETADRLGLEHVKALHDRAEDLARKAEYREKFDLCTSRAVANLAVLSEYCLPFVRKGGFFAAYKAGNSEQEIAEAKNAVRKLGGRIEKVIPYSWEGMERTLVVIKKENETPSAYPRKAGMPSRKPLT